MGEMPPLPDFGADAPAHVQREILGAFLVDRDAPGRPVVHRVAGARESCALDGIRSATFFHFWSEVIADPSIVDDLPCPLCLA